MSISKMLFSFVKLEGFEQNHDMKNKVLIFKYSIYKPNIGHEQGLSALELRSSLNRTKN